MADLDFNDVALFVRVVDRGAFAEAARELRVPTSTVSRAVARLEQALGTQLIHRTTRSMQPTEDGRAFYASAAPAIATLRAAAREREGSDRAPRGRLRVSAASDLAASFLAEVIVRFAERFPLVRVELEASSRTVNLVAEDYDVAVRAGPLADSSLVARRLGSVDLELYASAGYISARGAPASLDALEQHACVLFRPRDGAAAWTLHGPDGEIVHRARGRIGGDDYAFVRAAVVAGGGIGLLPRIVAAPDATAGRLVRVLPAFARRGEPLHVVYAPARNVPVRIAAFRDYLVEAFAQVPCAASGAGAAPRLARKPRG